MVNPCLSGPVDVLEQARYLHLTYLEIEPKFVTPKFALCFFLFLSLLSTSVFILEAQITLLLSFNLSQKKQSLFSP